MCFKNNKLFQNKGAFDEYTCIWKQIVTSNTSKSILFKKKMKCCEHMLEKFYERIKTLHPLLCKSKYMSCMSNVGYDLLRKRKPYQIFKENGK